MMETTDDKLLKEFFAQNKQEIEDKGFSRRVMHHLPDRYYRIAQLWSVLGFALAATLFVLLDGFQLTLGVLRKVFIAALQSGITEMDPKTLLLVVAVLGYFAFSKIKSLA